MLQQLHYWPRTYIQVGCIAFLVAVALMPIAIRLLGRLGVLDQVAANKIHTRPVARGGGIVIFIAFAVAVLFPNYRDNPMKGVLLGSAICLVVGAIDDIRGGIPATLKFFTLVGVTVIMSQYGVLIRVAGSYPIDLLLTIFWVVGVTSAINGIDNMDGLAGGISAIVSTMYLVIALQAFIAAGTETSLSWFGLLAAGLIGSNLGFLVYNTKPARIFMGDSGSFFLGFTLAALGVMGEWSRNPVVSFSIPMLILGVPIFDFIYILVARVIRGDTRTIRQVIDHCATDHLSHRLVWMGFGQYQAVLFIYLLCVVMGVSGVLLRNSTSLVDTALALFQGLTIISLVFILMAIAARKPREQFAEREPVASATVSDIRETDNHGFKGGKS
ncbi:MAG: undecaprenyl/decaprenyl-phosphate alpha-N-acetylglucosaminyl 1-phosphate transferase [Candidatus Hydrogenedentes bacterium]|nr:undecaprenyl/decaprenyl-phosphate alpha-N-acetylglucosaminyl 1-phosphate transferase [Candidatus Hydrogenedentota bacterium]